MNRMLLAVGGIAAVVALTLVGAALFLGLGSGAPGVGGAPPSPSPTSPPSPTIAPTAAPTEQAGVLFTSERHDYSLLLPDDSWTVAELPGQWVLGETFSQEGEGSDSVFRAEDSPRPYIVFNSQRVPAGTTFEDWVADHEAAERRWFPTCAPQPAEAGVVDGETAVIRNYLCGGSERASEAAWLHGGRAYALRVFWPEGNASQDPRPTLEEWMSRFRFND